MDTAQDTLRSFVFNHSSFKNNIRTTCPECSASRSPIHRKIAVLSIDHLGDRIVYNCHHCGLSGAYPTTEKKQETKGMSWKMNLREEVPKPVTFNGSKELATNVIGYFANRGISETTLKFAGITSGRTWFRDFSAEADCFGVPYIVDGAPTGVKLRSLTGKAFSWSGAGGQSLWNVDGLDPEIPIIITEGEVDALSFIEVGLTNTTSVPNGSPGKMKDNFVDPSEDKAFKFIWAAKDKINKCTKIIIATDGDAPGKALAEELARRIGRSKCWKVEFPLDAKDANAYMLKHGKNALIELYRKATPWPIAGLFDAKKYAENVKNFYDKGVPPSESTGFSGIDELYRVAPGQLTMVTGIPGSGKSEMIDQIMVNLAKNSDWKFAICSFENQPDYHIIKLTEKYIQKSFFNSSRRMTTEQRDKAIEFVDEHFLFLETADGARANIDSVLERASAAVMRIGIRGLVIDPYNYIEKNSDGSETEQVATILTKTRQWAIANSVHVWFVAHPQKLARDAKGNVYVPKGYDISGSANFYNIPDFGLTIHRNGDTVEFHNWKVRYKWWGQLGKAELSYDKEISCYVPYIEEEEWKAAAESF